jgi:hypothetical protein
MECWNDGMLGGRAGMMEGWNNGISGWWKDGMMEWWGEGNQDSPNEKLSSQSPSFCFFCSDPTSLIKPFSTL